MGLFEKFIDEFTVDNIQLKRCIQELFGCILTGNQQYKTCMLFTGTGNNGKTLLVNLLAKIFENYVIRFPDLNNINIASLHNNKVCIIEEVEIMNGCNL